MADLICAVINPSRPASGDTLSAFTTSELKNVIAFHQSIPGYHPTPLTALPALASALGVKTIQVKDESRRFGLNAFKALGASWAMASYLAQQLELTEQPLTFPQLQTALRQHPALTQTFATTTDGNHGRGVAWMARLLGQKAVINMPAGTTAERLQAIRAEGATAQIVPMNYDDAVRLTAKQAAEAGWIIMQDTAWPGYEAIPMWIMQGYSTLITEIAEQLTVLPTHLFVQAGVGAFAGAIQAAAIARWGEQAPRVIIVESSQADCLYRSAQRDDGQTVAVSGALDTIMAGLACGEVNTIAWPILRDHSNAFLSCADEVAALGMRMLAAPCPGDMPITSGESGAVGAGALGLLMQPGYASIAQMLSLDHNARVLLISTEGDTDKTGYRNIVWGGQHALSL
ncbi:MULTISPECIES: diaminopropionate ammonia-lyase [Enterobacteriaceae]|uniref:diaminopropionate ammonia-lyase n=1 Tax=Enterobacteriaceae TaxID=543 RepID=UPI0006686393|nr:MULTISPECIES: diaminopropionate ammonia-lyase [Enterobacteriaceae]